MKLTKGVKTIIEPATNKLDELGIPWQMESGGKHLKLLYSVNGIRFTQTISLSSSDARTAMNIKGDIMRNVRKVLGEIR